MSQQKSKKTLINWDLVSVNPNNKNWDWKDIFCFWGVNIQSVIGFSLLVSLYVAYDLNSYLVFFGTIIGSFFVYFFSNLIGRPSQKFGLPFVVLLRSSLGVVGAKYFGFIRCIVGISLFGIQTFFLSKALGYLIRLITFYINPTILDENIFLIFFLGMNIIDWFAIIIAILSQVFLFTKGMNFNRKIIKFSAITIYLGILIFFFSVLLNDVKFASQAFTNQLNFDNFLTKNNLLPFLSVVGTTFAYFSIIILNFGDFSRYVKDESELKKGNLSLMINLIIFSLMAFFIVSGIDAYLKQFPENLSRVLTNPLDIIGKIDNFFVTGIGLVLIIIASASTNLIVNFIPSQYTLINFIPNLLSLKKASIIISVLGFVIGIFWLTYLSQIGILSFIDTLGSFFGPIFGVMIFDYYLIKKSDLNNKDIYSLDNYGIYYYTKGWHIKGVYSVFLGFIFSASTIWNPNLMFLQSFSWIIGALVAGFSYYLLAKDY